MFNIPENAQQMRYTLDNGLEKSGNFQGFAFVQLVASKKVLQLSCKSDKVFPFYQFTRI